MIDLTAILYAQRSKKRGDEDKAHVADLYGCDRATWFRRNGFEPIPFTPDRQARFAIGHGYEGQVAKELRAAGYEVATEMNITYRGLTGHPDILLHTGDEHAHLIETKTTDARKPERTSRYDIQAAAYALAVAADTATVLVKYAGSHVEEVFDVNPEQWRDRIAERAAEIHERTAPGSPMPPPVGYPKDLVSWACPSYCEWAQCELHPQHEEAIP